MDYVLWKVFPCDRDEANSEIVAQLMSNLEAHHRGNRAPFHIGVHAQSFKSEGTCERKTLIALLREIESFRSRNPGVEYISIPDLFAWMDRLEGK